jgi:hypothetical protein
MHDVRNGIIGAVAGVGGAFLQWTQAVGSVSAAIGSVIGTITAAIMLWRLIRRGEEDRK